MSINWTKTGKTVSAEGRTVTYTGEGTTLTIESRLEHKPNMHGGTWDYTSYMVLDNGREIKERWRLADAKEYAEAYWKAMQIQEGE